MVKPTSGPSSLPLTSTTADTSASEPLVMAFGSRLTPEDYKELESSWITKELADSAMLRRVDSIEGAQIVGQKGKRDCRGIVIPYYRPGSPHPVSHRLRRDNPDWKSDRHGCLKPDGKYLTAPGGGNRLYFPVGITLDQLQDPTMPIVLVEGEKKAIALWRLAWWNVEAPRFIPIALAGVWNWRGTVGKSCAPNGARVDVKGPIADLDRINWAERPVIVLFDSDVSTNESVKWARKGIAAELAKRCAKVRFITLPADLSVNGIDDLLALDGPEKVLARFEHQEAGPKLSIIAPPQFRETEDGLVRYLQKENQTISQTQLTNFVAKITKSLVLDDGLESRREFEILGTLRGFTHRFTIAAEEFSSMDWAIQELGPTAITFPNQREYARTAIQSLSLGAVEQRIYAHTGWREVDGKWIYLHAAGAISASGAVADTEVRLPGTMGHYVLLLAGREESVINAVRASLRLTQLAPPEVAFPMLAATYRAALGETDFAIHLVAETGAFKSELAALHQQHFGLEMNRLHLPGAWSSTANALESMAFHAKDALFVIDDFAPQGNSSDVARYHATAERVFRSAGNSSGRGRLDSNANLRNAKPPRALILSTGEEIPRGHSVRARLLILEMTKGTIDPAKLTECQRSGKEGLYAEAMGAFIQHLALDFGNYRATLARKANEYRNLAAGLLGHARTPETIAQLQAGFQFFVEFACSIGAITPNEGDRLKKACWQSLFNAAKLQARHHMDTEPAARFIALLQSAMVSGRAYIENRDGGAPQFAAGACGWRAEGSAILLSRGDRIGWIDEGDIFLDPSASFRIAQLVCRDTGDAIPVTEQTLRKRLRERGYLASTDATRETITVRRNIGGTSRDVLHLHRGTLLPDAEAGENADTEALV